MKHDPENDSPAGSGTPAPLGAAPRSRRRFRVAVAIGVAAAAIVGAFAGFGSGAGLASHAAHSDRPAVAADFGDFAVNSGTTGVGGNADWGDSAGPGSSGTIISGS
jgi:hypothetical protein